MVRHHSNTTCHSLPVTPSCVLPGDKTIFHSGPNKTWHEPRQLCKRQTPEL